MKEKILKLIDKEIKNTKRAQENGGIAELVNIIFKNELIELKKTN